MIDIAEVITASEGFWDSTINWYNDELSNALATSGIGLLFVMFMLMVYIFLDNAKCYIEDIENKKVARIGILVGKGICIGLLVAYALYTICTWTIYFTRWHPADVYSKPTWDTFVEEAYDVAIIADDADDELGNNTVRPCVAVFVRETSDYVIDMTVKDANGYARDYRLVVKGGEITVIDLASNAIVTPVLESDEIAERLIALAKW